MSTYNEKLEEVKQSVESILNQTYQNIELIIVLDNPQNVEVNQWLKELEKLQEKIVICVEHAENKGLVQSLNDAFEKAKGTLIARMDADDICLPQRIEKQVEYMEEHPECFVLGCNRVDINEQGQVINNQRKVVCEDKLLRKMLKYDSPFTHPSLMIRREVMEKLNGYRNVDSAEDYDFFLRCKKEGYGFANLSEQLLRYRIRPKGISKSRAYQMVKGKRFAKKISKKQSLLIEGPDYNDNERLVYEQYLQAIEKKKYLEMLIAVLKGKSLIISELYGGICFKMYLELGGKR